MTEKDLARFRKKFYKDETTGCYIWIGAIADGYGAFYLNGKIQRAHRVIWEHENGAIPEGLCVLHNCPSGDNPSCVNPDHLWLGTPQDNMTDKSIKGRCGEQIVNSIVCNSLEDIFI